MLTPRDRLAAVALALGLAVTGCSGADDEPSAEGSAAGTSESASTRSEPEPSPTPTTDVRVPDGVRLTEPGAQLSFGETARVAYEVKRRTDRGGKRDKRRTAGTVLALTVDSARKGSVADLAGFNLTDPYQRRASYYYVRVTVKNVGVRRFGDTDVPLWGISGENTLLPPVEFTSAFARCPTEPLPLGFEPGARFRTCLVFLSPEKGALEGVSYRPTEDFTPIEWRGKVAVPRRDRGSRNRD